MPRLSDAQGHEVKLNSDAQNSLPVSVVGSLANILDTTAVWANSAAVNTEVNLDITLPTQLQGEGLYQIIVTNPSAVSALTVVVKNKETFGTAKYPELTRFGVVASTADGRVIIVQGLFGEAARLTLSNDTALGVSDGFTAYVRVRKL